MKRNQIRTIVLCTATALAPTLLVAQRASQEHVNASSSQSTGPLQQQAGATSVQDSTPTAGDTAQTMKDKMFLRKSAQGGLAEVKFGQLATQKASSDDVKTFAQKMVDDHTALNNSMAPIADSMGVRVPKMISKEDQAEYDKLSGLSGSDFDTEYLTVMVKDHHKDLREFRAEASETTDPTLKAAVEKGTKVIHEHTMMVDKLASDKGIPMPTHGARKTATPPTS
jgi:putative membrane protein